MEMKNRFQEAIQNVQRQRHLARRSVAMVLVLAMLTAMSVSWRLHQDGIALTADDTRYYCGKEEHKHTDDCYIEGTEPICGYEEGEIVEETMDLADDAGDGDSSAADWDEAGSEPESEPATQEEPEPEVVLHHHTSDCYEEEEVLTCGIESDHVHQDYCRDQETGELLCTEHEHTDDCYTLEEVLVCGYEEGEPEETDDGAALYDRDENSAEESNFAEEPETAADPEPEKEATKPETDDEIDTGYTVHHHTAECYGKVLICGKEEHEHTAACLVNPNAEIDAEYDAKTPARTDADWAEDMVLVAKSQLGYTESKADVDEDGNGYTMYADQYYKDKPMVYADWDCTFVAYCLYHAGVPQDVIPQYASISALRGALARMNSAYYGDDPQDFGGILPGDIVMYKNAEGRETIGVVSDAAVDEETDLTTALTVISGDVATGCESDGETTIDQVAEVSVALNEVTSFVSVNAAEGYGISDLMGEDTQTAGQELSGTPLELNEINTKNLTIKVKHTGSSGTDNQLVFEDGDKITVSGSFSVSTKKLKDAGTNTVRWKTGLKLQGRVEKEIILGGEVYGKYTVSENGVVDFVFNENAMNQTDIQVEDFGFDAEFYLDDNSNEKEIRYPGMNGTITLKRKSDIKVEKSSAQNGYVLYTSDGKPYIHFEVTVSTEKGTADKTLLIQDTIAHTAIKGHYDQSSFSLKKVSSNGTQSDETLPAGQPVFGGETPTFTVNNLPALKAGEKYVLSYDYYIDLDKCDNKTLLGVVKNNVMVQVTKGQKPDGPNDADSWETEFKTSITKTSRYDSNTNRIVWTVIVRNPEDGNDLNGYTVTDALETGTTAEITGKIYRYGGGKEDTSDNLVSFAPNEDKKGFTYKFPEGSTQKFYRFVYNTSAPAGETVKNNVTYKDLDSEEEKTSGTGSAGTRISGMVIKAPLNGSRALTDTNSNRIKKAGWWATIVPSADTKVVEFTDTFQQPVDSSGNPAKGAEHYALRNELLSELKAKIEIYLTDADASWYGDGNATSRGVNITYTFYDANGNVVEDNTTHVHSFKVRVDATNASVGNIWKINLGRDTDSNRYYTYVDLTGMQNGKDWTIKNQITSDQVTGDKSTSTSYYPYKKNKETVFEKTVFDRGYESLGRSDTISYGNEIWYQLWVVPEDGADTITIQDTLDKGLKFDDSDNDWNANYCAALRQNSQKTNGRNHWPSSNELTELTNNVSITASGTSEDGQVLNIKLTGLKAAMEAAEKANKPFDGVAIMYRVQVDDPDFWSIYENTDKTYANNAKWKEGGKEDTAKVTVSRNETYLEKSGKQEKSTSNLDTERVTYTIDINKNRDNLNPSKDKIKLTDHFTTVKNATAALESATVKKIEQNGTETKVPESDYRLETSAKPINSERTEYEIVLTVDDATYYKFTYTYKIDTSEVKESDFPLQLENKASIVGKWAESDKVSYSKVNGWVKLSADGVLKIRKVEKGKEQTTLPGAEFTLYRYDGNNTWTQVAQNVTPQNGEITYTPGTSNSCTVNNFGAHKLMKLVETKAPDDYTLDATPLYFIWRTDTDPSDSSLASGKQKDIFKAAIGSNADSVQDGNTTVSYNEVTYYGYGKTYEQTIRNAKQQIVLQKVWKDEAGHILKAAPDGISSINVAVYRIDNSTGEETKQGDYMLSASDGDGWTKTISVQAGYTYRVEETDIQSGYSVTYTRNFNDNDVMEKGSGYVDGDTATIVNRKLPTSLKVRKLWKDPDGNYKTEDLPDSITLQLYTIGKDGQKTKVENATITLPQDGKWEYTFTNLDPTAHYVVEEASVSGYTVSYSYPEGSSGATGVAPGGTVTITNTEAPTYELPSTGSPGGTVPYTAGGAAIALAAVLCGYNSRRKRKRGEE
jgi:hypothetical protein